MKKKLLAMMMAVVCLMGYLHAERYVIDQFIVSNASGGETFPEIDGDIVVWIDASLDETGPIHYKNLSTGQNYVINTSKTCSWSGWDPAIDGDTIVWTDCRDEVGGDHDIYGYKISTQTEFVVCTDGPQTAGVDIVDNLVVGVERGIGSDNYDIYGYDISPQTRFPICTAESYQYNPVTNGSYVVWADMRNGEDNWDIYGYHLISQTEFEICTRDATQEFASISGKIVVWKDERNRFGGNNTLTDIYGYNLSTHTEFAICTESAWQDHPSISGNFVVWADKRNGDFDIYGYDLATQTEFEIATGAGDQLNPAISGNTVVWEMNEDIYGAFIRTYTIVDIDIKPDDYPNPINLGSLGVTPVAVLTTENFDATTVDPATIEFAGSYVAMKKTDRYMAHEEDVNLDRLPDLMLQIVTTDINPDLLLEKDGLLYAVLTGTTYDGQLFEGWDEVTIAPP